MKKSFLITAVGIIGLGLSGCAHLLMPAPWVESKTEIIKNDEGKIISSHYTRTVKGLSPNDPETARSWAEADRTARNAPGMPEEAINTVNVIMENQSGYALEVTTGEFKGLVLASGEKTSYSKEIPIGAYTFRVKFIDDAGHLREWDVSRLITPKTDKIILKYVRR